MLEHYVLIIDDDPGAVEAFEPMLTARGYTVRAALDAESGIREIEHSQPSAIILDLHLPRSSGLDLLRQLRSGGHASVPIALVTGDYLLDDSVAVEIERLGVRLFFKPLWEDDLVQIVETLLNRRSATIGTESTARASV